MNDPKPPATPIHREVKTFSFGAPESVLTGNLGEYMGVFASDDGQIYTPPVSRTGLAKLLRANAHHGTIPRFKRNLLLRDFIPSAGCSTQTMGRAALDFMVFGESYFQRKTNVLGQVLELEHLPALNMRRKVGGGFVLLLPGGKQIDFDEDQVEHVMDYDVQQNIYGVPDYLGGMHALLLNESATLFRRRYYNNGAHAGFIFYTNDPNLSEADEERMRSQIGASEGVGNFRSLFMNIPGGGDKAIQIIPVGDIATKDEVCGGKGRIASRDELSLEFARLYCQCSSPHCGHTWVANLTFSHTVSPFAQAVDRLLFDRLRSLSKVQQRDLFDQLGVASST